jgi:hypothetical protein
MPDEYRRIEVTAKAIGRDCLISDAILSQIDLPPWVSRAIAQTCRRLLPEVGGDPSNFDVKTAAAMADLSSTQLQQSGSAPDDQRLPLIVRSVGHFPTLSS